MQVVVPTGVALSKGLTLAPALNGAKFTRCERDGCYVEALIDNATVTSIGGAGKSANIAVYGYGQQDKPITLPVSMTGFPEAMDRMKTFAKERAVALPPNTSPLPPAPPAVAPAPAKR
jgi:invasion protein IalB